MEIVRYLKKLIKQKGGNVPSSNNIATCLKSLCECTLPVGAQKCYVHPVPSSETEGIPVTFDEGMTWKDLCESEYNYVKTQDGDMISPAFLVNENGQIGYAQDGSAVSTAIDEELTMVEMSVSTNDAIQPERHYMMLLPMA